jgi:ribosome-associated heat shock protein Hsp15
MKDVTPTPELRLDKWLWAARFFKTRQLAVAAINGGKIQVNGQRAKPGRAIRPGARLEIHKESLVWEIEVLAINPQRRPASEAALLYVETEASRLKREAVIRERRDIGDGPGGAEGRPSKRDRRMIQHFTGRGESDAGS